MKRVHGAERRGRQGRQDTVTVVLSGKPCTDFDQDPVLIVRVCMFVHGINVYAEKEKG